MNPRARQTVVLRGVPAISASAILMLCVPRTTAWASLRNRNLPELHHTGWSGKAARRVVSLRSRKPPTACCGSVRKTGYSVSMSYVFCASTREPEFLLRTQLQHRGCFGRARERARGTICSDYPHHYRRRVASIDADGLRRDLSHRCRSTWSS